MDWQLSVMGPSITPVFWGLIRTPPEQRAYPYTLQAHYYARGPMGYGMGTVQVVRHDYVVALYGRYAVQRWTDAATSRPT